MDEITHQMVYRDLEGFYFNIKTGHVRFPPPGNGGLVLTQ